MNPTGQGPDSRHASYRLDAAERETVLLFLASPLLNPSTSSHATTISSSPQVEDYEVPLLPPRPVYLSSTTSTVSSGHSTQIFSATSSTSHISSAASSASDIALAEFSRPGVRLTWECLFKKRALRQPPFKVKFWEDLILHPRVSQGYEVQAKMCGKTHRGDRRCEKKDDGWICNGTKVHSLMLRSC